MKVSVSPFWRSFGGIGAFKLDALVDMWQLPQGPVGPSGRFISPHRLPCLTTSHDADQSPTNPYIQSTTKNAWGKHWLMLSFSRNNDDDIESDDMTETYK